MTVAQLIDALVKCPPDATVWVECKTDDEAMTAERVVPYPAAGDPAVLIEW